MFFMQKKKKEVEAEVHRTSLLETKESKRDVCSYRVRAILFLPSFSCPNAIFSFHHLHGHGGNAFCDLSWLYHQKVNDTHVKH